MVVRISTGKNIHGLLQYNEQKLKTGDAKLIMAHGFGTDGTARTFQQKLQRFKALTDQNKRVKTNSIHISLNFSPKDKLDENQLKEIAMDYMQRIGFGLQPFLVYQHFDAGHQHVHLVSTNIQHGGNRIETHNLGKTLSEKARKAIEKERGLTPAKGQRNRIPIRDLEKAVYGKSPSKETIDSVVTPILTHYNFTSFAQFNTLLKEFNVEAVQGEPGTRMYQNKGLVYSILDEKGNRVGNSIKASKLYDKPTMKTLERQFKSSKYRRDRLVPSAQNSLLHALQIARQSPNPLQQFHRQLRKNLLRARFHTNADGRVYGLTILDFGQRAVFKATELDRSLSGHKLMMKLDADYAQNINPGIKISDDQVLSWKMPLDNDWIMDRGNGHSSKDSTWSDINEIIVTTIIKAVDIIIAPELRVAPPEPYEIKRKKKRRRRYLQ